MTKAAAKRALGGHGEAECRELRQYLTERTGLNLREDRSDELREIVHERLSAKHPTLDCRDYVDLIRKEGEAGAELRFLVSRLTVGETHFFRNLPQFTALRKHILPDLIERGRARGRRLRIWSAGCSTGEEPYSLAMLLRELLPDIDLWSVSISATDINEEALAAARRGLFRNWSFREVEEHYRARYFIPSEGAWQIRRELIDMVGFRYLNLAEDCYPSAVTRTEELDLIVCRNVMIYFTTDLSLAVTGRFHACLNDGGYLLVGHTEHSEMISPVFQRKVVEHGVVYRKGAAESRWERAIKPRFRGSGKASASQVPLGSPARRNRGVQRPPGTPETVLFDKAVALYREKRLEESLALFREILKVNAGNERARYMLALLCADCGDLAEAERQAQILLGQNPLFIEAIYLLALVSRVRGDGERELDYLRRTVFLNPGFVLGHFQMGVSHLRSGRERMARRSLLNVMDLLNGRGDDGFVEGIDGLTVGRLRETVREMFPGVLPEEKESD